MLSKLSLNWLRYPSGNVEEAVVHTDSGGRFVLDIIDFRVISDYALHGRTEIQIQFRMAHEALIGHFHQSRGSLCSRTSISLFLMWGLMWAFQGQSLCL